MAERSRAESSRAGLEQSHRKKEKEVAAEKEGLKERAREAGGLGGEEASEGGLGSRERKRVKER